jgi:hypothetical protein
VYVNSTLSSLSCQFTAGASCADSLDSTAVNAGDRVAVVLNFVTGAPVPLTTLSIHVSLEKQ